MYTLISYSAGVMMEALIVKQTRSRIRLLVAGLRDAVELRRRSGGWQSESGERFEFEFIASQEGESVAPRTASLRACGSAAV